MQSYFFRHRAWLWPVIFVVLLTPFTPAIDIAISRHFFYMSQPPAFHSSPFETFMYDYGIVPGQLLFAVGAVMLFLACFFKRYKSWFSGALLLVLTLAIGSGLISHVLLKDHWGRPRPKQVIEFGGAQEFRPYYEPNIFAQPEPSKSFPCGHCTMGFYFFSLALVGYHYKKRWLLLGGVAIALGLGLALSWTRIVQGGHFFSDTLFAALIMWLTAYLCSLVLFEDRSS